MSERLVQTFDVAGKFLRQPKTIRQAITRYCIIVAFIFLVVAMDNHFHTAAFALMFGYALGSLSMWGNFREITVGQQMQIKINEFERGFLETLVRPYAQGASQNDPRVQQLKEKLEKRPIGEKPWCTR